MRLCFLPLLALAFPLAAQSPSAILIAAARAFASHEPDPTVRNPDWMADSLLGPDELTMLQNHPMGRAVNQDFRIASLDPEVSGLARPILLSTRFIDEHLTRALREGFTQVVILDAGLDSRPYRLRPLLINKKVVEIDDAATQQLKKRRIETVLAPLPAYVSYIAANLHSGDLPVLPRGKSVYIWESASMRYPEARVKEILRAISKSAAPGSLVLTDFVTQSQLTRVLNDPSSPPARWEPMWNEPWLFGIPTGQETAFFRSVGLEVLETLETNSRDASRRYLTRRDGTVFGPPSNAPGTGFEDALARTLVQLVIP